MDEKMAKEAKIYEPDKIVKGITCGGPMREDASKQVGPNCPVCGTELIPGFGLAGGGYGIYDFCAKCGKVYNKVETP